METVRRTQCMARNMSTNMSVCLCTLRHLKYRPQAWWPTRCTWPKRSSGQYPRRRAFARFICKIKACQLDPTSISTFQNSMESWTVVFGSWCCWFSNVSFSESFEEQIDAWQFSNLAAVKMHSFADFHSLYFWYFL